MSQAFIVHFHSYRINQMSTSHREYDVFLSFRGDDTRRNFISFFYKELHLSNIRTFKDDEELKSGDRISPKLIGAIEESRFAVVVVSVNYSASRWCLEELVKIMDLEKENKITVMPIFYGLDPADVRFQIGVVADHFEKHERRYDSEQVRLWRKALTNLANISGDCSLKWDDDSKMVDEITERISKGLMIAKPRRSGSRLVEIDRHMKALRRLLDLNSKKNVRVFGIWARGSNCRSALAKYLYKDISQHFESHCLLESVRRISQDRHMPHLRQELLRKIQGESLSKPMLKNQKVLLLADDVNKVEQIEALAEEFNNFGPGSIVIITTQDKQLLNSYGIKHVYEVDHLRFKIVVVGKLFRQLAFNKRSISDAFNSALFKVEKCLDYLFGESGYEKI